MPSGSSGGCLVRKTFWSVSGCAKISACSTAINSFAICYNAEVNGTNFAREVIQAILRAYVNDVPTCSPTEESSIELVSGLDLCACGGFQLTKFVANSQAVLDSIPADIKAEGFKGQGPLPSRSVLWVMYDLMEDTFRIRSAAKSGGGPWT